MDTWQIIAVVAIPLGTLILSAYSIRSKAGKEYVDTIYQRLKNCEEEMDKCRKRCEELFEGKADLLEKMIQERMDELEKVGKRNDP